MRYVALVYLFLALIAADATAGQFSHAELQKFAEQLGRYPSYQYPYPDLSKKLEKEDKTSLPLFIYGSLIDEKSASLTLSSQVIKSRRPAIAFGYKRVFNRDIPLKSDSRFDPPCNKNARGMLNVVKTEHLENFINGVLIDVPLDDIPALMKREVGYNLVPAVVTGWDSFLQGKVEYAIAYILQAPVGSVYVNDTVLPRPGYYELTRDAAKQYGPFYEMLWFNNTFMADGNTPVIIWEGRLHTKDAQVCR